MLPELGIECATPGELVREYGLDVLAVTEGENGASLYSARGECVTADGLKAAVVDTVGAGDAFAAVLAAAVMRNGLSNLAATLEACNAAGSAAVQQQGAHVTLPAGLLPPFEGDARSLQMGAGGTEMQLALDLVDIPGAKRLYAELERSGSPPEIVEVGTPVVIKEGMAAVTVLRDAVRLLNYDSNGDPFCYVVCCQTSSGLAQTSSSSAPQWNLISGRHRCCDRCVRSCMQVGDSVAVLADLKIMDAGEHEANLAFEAGADIVTVLG
jgi:hypothetical protein